MKDYKLKINGHEYNVTINAVNDASTEAKVVVNGVKIITARMDGTTPNELRSMCDQVKGDDASAVCLFAAVNGENVTREYCNNNWIYSVK